MKRLSLDIKQNKTLNNQLHDLIPDEREASIESAKLIYYFVQQSNILNTEEYNETNKNLNFYLTNGYLYNKKLSIYPYQSISKFDNTIPMLIYENIETYNKLIYGFDIKNNPTLSLLINKSKTFYEKEYNNPLEVLESEIAITKSEAGIMYENVSGHFHIIAFVDLKEKNLKI